MQILSKNRKRYVLSAHIVLTVKYRKSLLDKFGDFIKNEFYQISRFYDFEIQSCGCDKNHIHVIVNYKSNQNLSSIIKQLKQISTYNIWNVFGETLRKHFWKQKVFWNGGYFVSSIGANENIINEYVLNQGRQRRPKGECSYPPPKGSGLSSTLVKCKGVFCEDSISSVITKTLTTLPHCTTLSYIFQRRF